MMLYVAVKDLTVKSSLPIPEIGVVTCKVMNMNASCIHQPRNMCNCRYTVLSVKFFCLNRLMVPYRRGQNG